MEPRRSPLLNCPLDILLHVLEHLLADSRALYSLGLVCRFLRNVSLPFLLQTIDLSSHNNGRQPEYEDEFRPEIHADYSDEYRPLNLVRRQRAFLRLITLQPNLAAHVRSLKWTLIWTDFDEEGLTEIDLKLWNVFSRLINVRELDLASIRHQIVEDRFIRCNPSRLFPAVTHLRLVGWMHRGLVDAIINSVDPANLLTLKLDYLQDEGQFPNGTPMSEDIARKYGHLLRDIRGNDYGTTIVIEQLEKCKRNEKPYEFPGPMWTALRLLKNRRCTALRKFEIRIAPYNWHSDVCNYLMCFDETAKFISLVGQTLESATIVFGVAPWLYANHSCGTARGFSLFHRRLDIALAAGFLRVLLPAISKITMLSLVRVTIAGFHLNDENESNNVLGIVLRNVDEPGRHSLLSTWHSVIRRAELDRHEAFLGYDYYPDEDTLQEFFDHLG